MPSFCVSSAINRWAGMICGLPAELAACNAAVSAAWVLVVGLNESTTPPIMLKEVRKCLSQMFNAVKVESVPLNFNFFRRPAVASRAAAGQWAGMPIGLHIAVVAASAPSHMHPHLAVVRELVNRGHRVSYLVSRPPG